MKYNCFLIYIKEITDLAKNFQARLNLIPYDGFSEVKKNNSGSVALLFFYKRNKCKMVKCN